MDVYSKKKGSAILLAVFAVALISAFVLGILHVNTEEMQIVTNQVETARAKAIAEAGLNDAMVQLRTSPSYSASISDTFDNGSYVVTFHSPTLPLSDTMIRSIGTTSTGYIARIEADVTLGSTSPYKIRIDSLRINE